MTTTNPDKQPLTRRQLRELRATGAVPTITPESQEADAPADAERTEVFADDGETVQDPSDPGRLSRKHARHLRTESVPVVAEDDAAEITGADEEVIEAEVVPTEQVEVQGDASDADAESATSESTADDADENPADEPENLTVIDESDDVVEELPADEPFEPEQARVVAEGFGAELLAGDVSADLPASFDALLTREHATAGTSSSPSTLILTEIPDTSIASPIAATGEVLVTGSFSLPSKLGSTGSANGGVDATDADAAIADGELVASSSPTPIAASAAVSTIRTDEDIIAPPAPDRGNRLMVILAITAGVLAAGLAGVLMVALLTGVFQ